MIKQVTVGNKRLEIYQDEDPENPRDWDNLGKLICFHRRYSLGDKHDYKNTDYAGWDELEEQLRKDGAIIVLPLFLYDHSGLWIKVGSFQGMLAQGHAEFDSGKIGFACIFHADLVREYGRNTPQNRATAEKVLRGEVDTYAQFVSGEVYGQVCKEQHEWVDKKTGEIMTTWETEDSCGGFYGSNWKENGLIESLPKGYEKLAEQLFNS
jgi:hypothetical protein